MLVSVTRVLNEDDIIEAFIRHNAAYVDRMVLLDNGSTDRTEEILRALHAEGYPITLLRVHSVHFVQSAHSTIMFHAAVRSFAPDWVLPLDADEFIDARHLAQGLPARLAAVPPEIAWLQVPLVNYYTADLTTDDLLIPRRFSLRDTTKRNIVKCMVRSSLATANVTIDAGNHAVWVGDTLAPSQLAEDMCLAHYPVRHPAQWMVKATLGRLKALATGSEAEQRQWSKHYTPMLDLLRTEPSRLWTDQALRTMPPPGLPLTEDPIAYAGLPLCHTRPDDPVMKAIRGLAAGAEQLARHHGRLLDAEPALRKQANDWAMEMAIIF